MSGETPSTRRVQSAGVTLSVHEHTPSAPGRPTVVLVHGYPDRQQVWDDVVRALPHDDLHLVTYDVRGAGASDVPLDRASYATELLVEDLAAVVDAVVPDRGPVHLVGHDWGSVQLWDAVNEERGHPRLDGRIASFTSISGPSLDHVAARARHGARGQVLKQQLRSWYVVAFHVPAVPELVLRRFHRQIGRLAGRNEPGADLSWGPEVADDAVHGLELYRANVLRRPKRLRTGVPVLVVHPRHDPYLTRFLSEGLEPGCSDVRRVELDAGHWVIRSRAGEVAELVADHVGRHHCAPPA